MKEEEKAEKDVDVQGVEGEEAVGALIDPFVCPS